MAKDEKLALKSPRASVGIVRLLRLPAACKQARIRSAGVKNLPAPKFRPLPLRLRCNDPVEDLGQQLMASAHIAKGHMLLVLASGEVVS